MKKKYTVSVNEPVLKMEANRYEIVAESEEEAIEKYNESSVQGAKIIDVKTKNLVFYAISALLMIIAIRISFMTWDVTVSRKLFGLIPIGSDIEQKSFNPNMTGALWAVAFHCAYIVRIKTVKKVFTDPIQIVFTVLIVFLLSGFFNLVVPDKADPWVVFALVFSWLGISIASIASYAIILVSSLSQIESFSNAMGQWGTLYVICVYVGLFMYFAQDVDWKYIQQNIVDSFLVGSNHVKTDYYRTKETISNIDLSELSKKSPLGKK